MAVSKEDFEGVEIMPEEDENKIENILAFPNLTENRPSDSLEPETDIEILPLFDGTRETRALYQERRDQRRRDEQDKKILESGEIEKIEPYKNDPEYLVSGQKEYFLDKEGEEQKWNKEMQKAPVFTNKELKNNQGEVVDFDQAQSYAQLIKMIEQEKEIVNQLGQKVLAETIINDIFKLTYQDLRDFESTDWTRITLKHNLRKAVARLIREYKESDEFKMLGGLDWSRANTIEDLKNVVRQKTAYKNAKNEPVTFREIISYIDNRQYELLPAVIRFKLREINRLEEMNLKPQEDTSFKGKVSNWWSKLTSRFTK